MLYFAAQRVCEFRSLEPDEQEDISSIELEAETLEFFEDFFAGFLQLLLQMYISISTVTSNLKTPVLVAEIIASILSILSMMVAIRRRDDGPLTSTLSFFGWIAIITSRVLIFSLIGSLIHSWLVLILALHSILFTFWVFKIAVASQSSINVDSSDLLEPPTRTYRTSGQRRFLFLIVFCFFGLPSLFYWPIMFELKEHWRPQKFLIIVLVENILLLTAFVMLSNKLTLIIELTVWMAGVSTVFGLLMVFLYICVKPTLTDMVVLHDLRIENKAMYGFYFQFCQLIFKMPSLKRIDIGLKEIRKF